MTIRELTAEQKRREQEYRQFQAIERKLAAQPRVSRGRSGGYISTMKKKAVKSINQLSKSNQILFLKREAGRIDQAIKKESKARIPTLADINKAGYNYGKSHPTSARLIYNSMEANAKIIRKIVPKEAGIPVAKAMYAFSDGSIKGIRNEPVKTLAFFALPGAVGAVAKVARYVPIASKVVKSEKAMKAAAAAFDIGYSHNVYQRVNAPVLGGYKEGKTTEKSRTLSDGSTEITTTTEMIPVMRKPNVSEKSERLGYIFSTEAGPMVFGAMGMQKVSKARFNELSRTAKTKIKETKKIIKGKDVKTTVTEKVSSYKKAAKRKEYKKRMEQAQKEALNKNIKTLEVTKSGKLKLLEKKRSQLIKDAKKADMKKRAELKKQIENVNKNIKKAQKQSLKKKVDILEVTKTGKLKKKTVTVKQLKSSVAKAKAKERKEIKKRHAKIEKAKEEIPVLKVSKKGKLKVTKKKRKYALEEQTKAKAKERKEIKKRISKVEKRAKKQKVAKLKPADRVYANIHRITRLRAKLTSLIAKIKAIPAKVARRIGLNKQKEIRKLNVLVRETDTVRTYIVMMQKGATKKVVVANIEKLPQNKLQVIDKKTGKIIKDIEKTVKDTELRVIKPSKTKIPPGYKEVKTGKGTVQLQKIVQKQKVKTVQLVKSTEKLNTKAKTQLKSLQKSKTKTRIKEIQVTRAKLKSNVRTLRVYRGQLGKYLTQLKQEYRLIQPATGKTVTKTDTMYTQIQKTDEVISQTDKVIHDTINNLKIISDYITVQTPKTKTKFKEQLQVPRIKVKPLMYKKEPAGKKKKRKVKKGIKEAYVKNPVPSIKEFIG